MLFLVGVVCALTVAAVAQPRVWPDWNAKTATGETFGSRQLDGKVVVISVWGSWCPSCRKQMPVLDALQEFYQDQPLQVLAFSLDHTTDGHEQFVRQRELKIPSIFAREGNGLKVVKMLQQGAGTLEAVPTVLIYDKRGRLAHRLVGFFNRRQLEEMVAPLLSEE